MQYLGFNYRLTDIQAALGLSQLLRVKEFVKRRREIAKQYDDFFENLSDHIDIIKGRENEKHSYHLYVIKLREKSKRREIFEYLSGKEIYCQVHYIPIYRQPYYRQRFGYSEYRFPEAEKYYSSCISLPLFPDLDEASRQYILEILYSLVQ